MFTTQNKGQTKVSVKETQIDPSSITIFKGEDKKRLEYWSNGLQLVSYNLNFLEPEVAAPCKYRQIIFLQNQDQYEIFI